MMNPQSSSTTPRWRGFTKETNEPDKNEEKEGGTEQEHERVASPRIIRIGMLSDLYPVLVWSVEYDGQTVQIDSDGARGSPGEGRMMLTIANHAQKSANQLLVANVAVASDSASARREQLPCTRLFEGHIQTPALRFACASALNSAVLCSLRRKGWCLFDRLGDFDHSAPFLVEPADCEGTMEMLKSVMSPTSPPIVVALICDCRSGRSNEHRSECTVCLFYEAEDMDVCVVDVIT
ncbi:hypothetical protein BLNAU_10828 [Blattamonas nauphoetae]|uniref:Uncharacterized protein n=1 Tax=Blattamonas nauphoetae TaxID=2049346 RepID=A0ABQ9XSG2_9EUKA|nr:hypothetical protein BLNAU_10828 [Blattamonas nauphoetae]